jgi:small-conductance mechanosensitive channel
MDRLIRDLELNPLVRILGNPLIDWLLAAAIGVAIFLALMLLRRVAVRRLRVYAASESHPGLRLLARVASRTLITPLLAISLVLGARYLDLSPRIERVTGDVLELLIALQIGLWFAAAVSFYMEEKQARSAGTGAITINILNFGLKFLIWTIVLLFALSNLGVNISAALTSLGIAGVAVAFALQNLLGDLLASISIALDQPFAIGDTLTIDTLTGTVEQVGIRSTRLRSVTGEQIVIANSDVVKSRLRNWSRVRERRKIFSFRVAYDTPLAKLATIPAMVRGVIESRERARFERCQLRNLGDYALEFEVAMVSEDPGLLPLAELEQAVNVGILRGLAEQNIEMPVAATVAVPTRSG